MFAGFRFWSKTFCDFASSEVGSFRQAGIGSAGTRGGCRTALEHVSIIPRHPLRGSLEQLSAVSLQLRQVVESVGAAELAGVDEAVPRQN
jgi:hypothetical protein